MMLFIKEGFHPAMQITAPLAAVYITAPRHFHAQLCGVYAEPFRLRRCALRAIGSGPSVRTTGPAVSKHDGSDQPCLCLCFGFSQITRIVPLRLMTLHFSHMGFTDALTFTMHSPFPFIYVPTRATRRRVSPVPAKRHKIIARVFCICKRFVKFSSGLITCLSRRSAPWSDRRWTSPV